MEKAFERSYDNLNLGYIDLYLMHYPVAYRRVLQNIRLPSDDVNAFHVFPVDKEGKHFAQTRVNPILTISFFFFMKFFLFELNN